MLVSMYYISKLDEVGILNYDARVSFKQGNDEFILEKKNIHKHLAMKWNEHDDSEMNYYRFTFYKKPKKSAKLMNKEDSQSLWKELTKDDFKRIE